MDIRAAEISSIIKDQIANFGTEADVAEVGQVSPSATVCPRLRPGQRPGR